MLFLLCVLSILGLSVELALCRNIVYPMHLTWQQGSPDGNTRYLVHVNGQFPGPELRLRYGDTIEIPVTNSLPMNATIHFHGIEQQGTPEYDGVPGLSQLAIEPGHKFIYRWTATQYGSYWYHGHFDGLIADGLFGAIYIEPPAIEPRSYAQISRNKTEKNQMLAAESRSKSILLSDWTKFTSEEYLQAEQSSQLDLFCMDSILINGKGAVNCQDSKTLNSLLNPNLLKILQHSNISVSDKGCTPTDPRALTQGQFNNTDPTKIPAGLQSGCVATNGSQSEITVNANNTWVAFNFISAMTSKTAVLSIDDHPMWIYAVDGQYIQPQLIDAFQIYNGERYSVMVKLDKPGATYTIRVANSLPDQLIAGYARLSYRGRHGPYTSTPSINYAGVPVNDKVRVLNLSTLEPFNQAPPSSIVDATYILSMGRYGSNWQWTLNNVSSFAIPLQNLNPPLLYQDQPQIPGNDALLIRTKNNTWVDIILEVTLGPQNPAQPPHPTHKHGNKGYLIGAGTGLFNYSSVAEAQKHIPQSFNIGGAVLRDSFTTPAVLFDPAWVAMRYHVVNPGAWLLHCHIQTHLAGGMAMAILDGVDMWPYPVKGVKGPHPY